ncbi:MAG TPA: adenosylmethionine--8-amino-7-oxononanoate transaminase [Candidatus Omnitrophota bacterium]|nr:adenosylmethionine--8-amino-7-oxononanoate transaminase [Candidatus Omnitrophota bacterium]
MNSWLKKDFKYIWHPFTQMKDAKNSPPVLVEKARGIKLFDGKGDFYYDTISSWWCNVHGHSHPKIVAAIKKQLDSFEHVLFAGFTHKPAIKLAEKLVNIAPKGLTKVFFSDNGSTSVEVAMKMSFQYWHNKGKKNKTKFVCLDRGYHGDTIGAMSVSGRGIFNRVFSPMFFPSFKAPSPYCYRCSAGKIRKNCALECADKLEGILKKNSGKIAGLILEPMVMAAGGMIIYPKEYLSKAAKLARKYDVHLILDEVATGFGRTGKMFACQHAGVSPDFMCLSKGITSGYLPLAATLTKDEIYNAFYADYFKYKTFYHGHTYTANPLACSAAIASLEIFEKENTVKKVQKVILHFHKGLERFRALEMVGDIRKLGMIAALELKCDPEKRIGQKIYKEGLKNKLVMRPLGDIIYFFLPLCVKINEIDDILDRAFKVLKGIRK